jgi:hypothetical protein
MSEQNQEIDKDKQILDLESKNNSLTAKSLKLYEENQMIKSSEAIAMKKAELDYQLQVAKIMIESKAFPNVSPQQAVVLMKAGLELELTEMEAMTDLYIVNGSIQFHSKGLVKRLTSKGYKIRYFDETDKGVMVEVLCPNGEVYTEIVKDTDQILTKSKAMSFAKKNKMRYHGVRMIANFYLPHLLGSVGTFELEDVEITPHEVVEPEKDRLIALMKRCKNVQDLMEYSDEAINLNLTHVFDEIKSTFK